MMKELNDFGRWLYTECLNRGIPVVRVAERIGSVGDKRGQYTSRMAHAEDLSERRLANLRERYGAVLRQIDEERGGNHNENTAG